MTNLNGKKATELTMEALKDVNAGGCGFRSRPEEQEGYQIIQILPGDTMAKLAARYHTTVAKLLTANPEISNGNLIRAGYYMYVPA